MKKVDQIRNFIIDNAPTRKELVHFIVVTMNKKCTSEEFEAQWSKRYRGYYATAITNWKYKGYIEVKNKKYYVTKDGKNAKGLFATNWKRQAIRLDKHNDELRAEIAFLRGKLRDINFIIHNT